MKSVLIVMLFMGGGDVEVIVQSFNAPCPSVQAMTQATKEIVMADKHAIGGNTICYADDGLPAKAILRTGRAPT